MLGDVSVLSFVLEADLSGCHGGWGGRRAGVGGRKTREES